MNGEIYLCETGQDCYINCSNPIQNNISIPFNCNGGSIIGGNATKLTIDCIESNSCNDIIINCPSNNLAVCELFCHEEGSCNNFKLYTYLSSTIIIECGNNLGNQLSVINSICINGFITTPIQSNQSIQNINDINNQNIILKCTKQLHSQQPICDNIKFEYFPPITFIYEITVEILCQAVSNNDGVVSCLNIVFDGANLTEFMLDATGGIKSSQIDINSVNLNQFTVIINTFDGFMDSIIINLNNSNSNQFNLTSNGLITNSVINVDMSNEFIFMSNGSTEFTEFMLQSAGNVQFIVENDGIFEENKVITPQAASFFFSGNGKVETNIFNLNAVRQIIFNVSQYMENNFIHGMQSELFMLNVNENGIFNNGQNNIINLINSTNVYIKSFGTITNMNLLALNANILNIINKNDGDLINSEIQCSNTTDVTFVSESTAKTENVIIYAIFSIFAQFKFYGIAKEIDIYANHSQFLDVTCSSFHSSNVCSLLALYGPKANVSENEFIPNTKLECIAFGCKSLFLNFENGIDDIELIASDCPCADNHTSFVNVTSVDSVNNNNIEKCIDEWYIMCGKKLNSTSIFGNDFDCKMENGNINCCGDLNDKANTLQCLESEENGFWTTGLIVGVIVGSLVLMIIVCVVFLVFYKTQKDAKAGYNSLMGNNKEYGATTY